MEIIKTSEYPYISKKDIYYLEEERSFWKILTLTAKTIKLERIKDENNEADDIGNSFDNIQCKWNNKCKHCIRNWGDGTFTIYPYRGGQPYYFCPLIEGEKNGK